MSRGRLLTTREAAEAFFVPEQTLRTWSKRKDRNGCPLLAPAGLGMWWELDVADAELKTRRKARAERLAKLAGGDQ